MKRKHASTKQKQKMPPVVGLNEGFLNNVSLNAQDDHVPDQYDSAEFESRTEIEIPENGRNETDLSNKASNIKAECSRGFASSGIKPTSSNTEPVHLGNTHQKDPKFSHQDPLCKEQELKAALAVIRKVMKMDAAEPFNVPVDPIALGIPDYFDVIDTPMDFGTICNNLENGVKYKNSKDVFRDVQYIWDNCSEYNNEGHYILELMKRVKKNFIKLWKEAGLHWEQPQEISGKGHLSSPPPAKSMIKFSKRGPARPVGPMTDYVSFEQQVQIAPSQMLPLQSSVSYKKPNQLQQGTCPVQLKSSQSQPSQPQTGWEKGSAGHLSSPPPAESMIGFSKRGPARPVGPMTDYVSFEQQVQIAPSQMLPHQSSESYKKPNQLQQGTCPVQLKSSQSQPQTGMENGSAVHLCSPPPVDSTMRCSKRGPKCPVGPMTSCASQEQENQIAPTEMILYQPLASYDQPHHPQPPQPVTHMVMRCADSSSNRRKTRGRGPTRCLDVWKREGKIRITTNELGQPVGVEAPKLTNFLGTIARNGHLAPLNYVDWRAVPNANKESMWQQVQSKFDIEAKCKSWVLQSISKKWKDWKAELKASHYNTHETDEERLEDRDERVLPDQWQVLISFWNSKEAKDRSVKNKANRSHQRISHATGTKSFARIREEQRVKMPDGKEPSQADLFILTRTRKDGQPLNEASSELISQLRERAAQQKETSQNGTIGDDDIFCQVMEQDRHGHVRTYGLGPSPSDLGGPKPSRGEPIKMVSAANEEVHDIKERMVAMEQSCAQMATQMATMMSMMSGMYKLRDEHGLPPEPTRARLDADASSNSRESPQLQVHPSSSVQEVPSHQ